MHTYLKRTCQTVLLIAFTALTGCAAIYNDFKTPMPALSVHTDAAGTTKVGRSVCTSYVWVVALGDCSLTAAMKTGGISKVHHVDTEIYMLVFGIYRTATTVVYGE